MNSGRPRAFRWLTSCMAAVLMAAGLVGIVELAPAGAAAPAAVVPDQGLSAVGSPIWQTNREVLALDTGGGVLYAGGSFTSVRPPGAALGSNETARNHLAAFNTSTGALITSFNPNVNGDVYDVDVSSDGTKLYVVGSFTTVGGQTRQRIARLNLPSGSVDTAWTANANAIVATVTSDASSVYVGGDFTNVKNTARTRVAKLNTTNGNVVTAFNASSDKRITESVIAPASNRLLIGGENDVINGQPQAGIASLDPTTGALMPWASTGIMPRPGNGGCEGDTTDIIVNGTVAYVTGGGVEPGMLGGLLRRQHLRRLPDLQRGLPRRIDLAGHRQRAGCTAARTTTTAPRTRMATSDRTTPTTSSGTGSRRTSSPPAGSATGPRR